MQGWENHWQEWRLSFPPKVWTWGYFAAALERNRNSERSLSLWGSPPSFACLLDKQLGGTWHSRLCSAVPMLQEEVSSSRGRCCADLAPCSSGHL